jgi:hypothetical protein
MKLGLPIQYSEVCFLAERKIRLPALLIEPARPEFTELSSDATKLSCFAHFEITVVTIGCRTSLKLVPLARRQFAGLGLQSGAEGLRQIQKHLRVPI